MTPLPYSQRVDASPSHISPAFEAQQALERAFKGLLTATNDGARFRRDAALMWRHTESTRPVADRNGAKAMEDLLSATAEPDGQGCTLTRFSEAYRRGDIVPDPTDAERGLSAATWCLQSTP